MDSIVPVLSALALLLLPGLALCLAFGARDGRALAYAPALSAGLWAMASGVLHVLHVPFGLAGAAVSIGAGIAVAAGLRRSWYRSRGRRAGGPTGTGAGLGRPGDAAQAAGPRAVVSPVGAALTLVAALLLVWVPLARGMGGIGALNGAYDAFFHYSALRMIRESGDAFALTALADMYDGTSTFYPTTWHAIASLVPGDPVVAANAMVIATLALVPLGAFALVSIAFGKKPPTRFGVLLLVLVALTSAVFLSPAMIGVVIALWPFLLGTALLPAGAAAILDTGHRFTRTLVVAGVIAAHPSVAVSLAVIAGLVVLVKGVRAAVAERSWARALAFLLPAVGAAAAYAVLVPRLFEDMQLTKPVPHSWLSTALVLLADRPRVRAIVFDPWPLLPLYALVIVGIVVAWRHQRTLGIVAALLAAAAALLTYAAQDTGTWFSLLSAPWYGARERLQPLMLVALLIGAGLGVRGLLSLLASWQAAGAVGRARVLSVGIVVALVAGIGAGTLAPTRHTYLASLAYHRWGDHFLPYVSASERAFIEESAADLPPGSVVLGSPLDGASLYYALGGVEVVYPSLSSPHTLDQRRIGRYAGELSPTDPVCASMRGEGVTHVYVDRSHLSGEVVNAEASEAFGGIAQIPPTYLTEVDREGDFVLYAISLPCP